MKTKLQIAVALWWALMVVTSLVPRVLAQNYSPYAPLNGRPVAVAAPVQLPAGYRCYQQPPTVQYVRGRAYSTPGAIYCVAPATVPPPAYTPYNYAPRPAYAARPANPPQAAQPYSGYPGYQPRPAYAARPASPPQPSRPVYGYAAPANPPQTAYQAAPVYAPAPQQQMSAPSSAPANYPASDATSYPAPTYPTSTAVYRSQPAVAPQADAPKAAVVDTQSQITSKEALSALNSTATILKSSDDIIKSSNDIANSGLFDGVDEFIDMIVDAITALFL
jgi:hypothetical protein